MFGILKVSVKFTVVQWSLGMSNELIHVSCIKVSSTVVDNLDDAPKFSAVMVFYMFIYNLEVLVVQKI